MTDELTDDVIVARLRRIIRLNGIKLTDITEATGIPYRTLQNQLNGTNRISALNLLKVLDATNIPAGFLTEEGADLNVACLVVSLHAVLGDHIPRVKVDERGEYLVTLPTDRTRKELMEDAAVLAAEISREYGIFSVQMTDSFARAPGDPEPPSDPIS